MATTKKAVELARYIEEEIKLRLPALAVTFSFDDDENPLVQVGDGGAGDAGGLFKVMPISWPLAKDSLGNTAYSVGPHKIMFASEANYAATSDNIADINTTAQLLPLIAVALSKGCRFEWWQEASGTPPAITTFDTASKLKAVFEASLQYPMVQSQ